MGISLDEISRIVDEHPDSVKVKDSDHLLPLHFACEFGASIEVVKCFVEKYPHSVKSMTFIFEGLPLHFSCKFGALIEVVEFLVE